MKASQERVLRNNFRALIAKLEECEQLAHSLSFHEMGQILNDAKNKCGYEMAARLTPLSLGRKKS